MNKTEILREYCDGADPQTIAKTHGVPLADVKRICNAHWDTSFKPWDAEHDRPTSQIFGNVVGID